MGSEPTYWKTFPMWEGSSVYVIGGGPSLKGADLSPLKSRRVIGVNDAAFHYTDLCDCMFFGDKQWFVHHRWALKRLPFFCVTSTRDRREYPKWLKVLHRQGIGITTAPSELGWNGNSGIAALNLAVKLGASTVYLLGFDFKLGQNGESNWHENLLNDPDPMLYKSWIPFVEKYVGPPLEKLGINVWNANPDSDLNVFPKCTMEWALA